MFPAQFLEHLKSVISELRNLVNDVNQLVKTLRESASKRRDFYNDRIKHLFDDLVDVHNDYHNAVLETIEMINAAGPNATAILERLRTRKSNLDTVRSVIIDQLAPFFQKHSPSNTGDIDDLIFKFARRIYLYFQFSFGTTDYYRIGTGYSGLIALIELLDDNTFTLVECQERLGQVRATLVDKWNDANMAHTKLKSVCLDNT